MTIHLKVLVLLDLLRESGQQCSTHIHMKDSKPVPFRLEKGRERRGEGGNAGGSREGAGKGAAGREGGKERIKGEKG